MSTVSRRAFLSSLALPALVPAADSPVNLLFVLSDDHSAPYLGCYGATWMSTPNLDAFAKQGMRFDHAYTAAPQCVPSRAAFMTGRSAIGARVGRFNTPLPRDVVSLPELLRTKGYFTGVCGRYFHLDGPVQMNDEAKDVYAKHDLKTWKRRVDYLDVSNQFGTTKKFEDFLGKVPAGSPWFFWINYNDPHHPWDKDAGKVDPAKIKLPPELPDLPGVREDLARYCGEIERADRLFGEVAAVLRQRGLEQNTLVVFMGDNGMAFPHGKGSLYDPGLHVPLLVRWPGHVKPGTSTKELVSGEDLTPTLLEAAGVAQPKEMSGRSFLGLVTGSASYQPRQYVFAARMHHGNAPVTPQTKASGFDLSRCVRNDRWKLIYNCTPQMEYQPVDSARDPGWQQILAAHRDGKLTPEQERTYFQRLRPTLELYDLKEDPSELKNLADRPETKDVQRQLVLALSEKMITDYDYLPPPAQ